MEVLLRKNYQWVEVTFNPTTGSINNAEGKEILLIDIVSIKDDERSKYVICKNCGEIIRNTAANLEKHHNKAANSGACIKCKSLRVYHDKELSRKYELNADGTYKETVKTECKLTCTQRGYSARTDINSADARISCKYAQCRENGVRSFEDVFSTHPEVFDKIATVDALDNSRWTLEGREADGTFVYKAHQRIRVYAIVNSMGIIDHFEYCYNRSSYRFVYSAKYNKVFWFDGPGYNEKSIDVDRSKVAEITATVAKIYKE